MRRHPRHPFLAPPPAGPRPVAAPVLALLAALCAASCAGRVPAPAAAPAAVSAGAPASAAVDTSAEEGGKGLQILTADLVQRQEVHTGKLLVRWTIVAGTRIQSVTINGEPQAFPPGDTLQIAKELTLTLAQTVVTVVATDAKAEKVTRTYLIVNPELPLVAPEAPLAPPTKIAESATERAKQEAELARREELAKAAYKASEYTAWLGAPQMKSVYNREVQRGSYPVWLEAWQVATHFQLQYRAVFKPVPANVVAHHAYWGLTPQEYNSLVDTLSAQGFQELFLQVFRPSDGSQWMIQTGWVLKKAQR